jgi:hypothetical protein
MTVESLSYGLAAVAGLFAAAFALRGRVPLKAGITLACVLSVVWAGLLAAMPLWPELQRTVWPYVAELARVIAWQAVLIALIWRDVVHEKSSRWASVAACHCVHRGTHGRSIRALACVPGRCRVRVGGSGAQLSARWQR